MLNIGICFDIFLIWSYLFFTLGYSDFEVKQTCQRCELDVSKKDGIYNLIVQNVRLGEDEYYECQVSPGKTSINSLPLRAPVHLTIQGKMKSVKCNYNQIITPLMISLILSNIRYLICSASKSDHITATNSSDGWKFHRVGMYGRGFQS